VQVAGISRAAIEALVAYEWPGNVRQLEKEMGRAALFLEDGELLDSERLQPIITESDGVLPTQALKEAIESFEREHIRMVLAENDGEVAPAAERLEIGISTLYRRMKMLGIDVRE
jgi:transcriptional regulator with PAS, ATPase and Fis domain